MTAEKTEGQGPQVTVSRSFAAIVRKEGPTSKLEIVSQQFFQNELNKFKDGEQVSLVLSNRRPKRSEQQNRYYWGVYLPRIARETGEKDLDRLHELFKGKFLTEGVVEVLGEKVRLKRSTTRLSVSEFCQFIIDIETLTGVEAPPTESYGLVPLSGAAISKPPNQQSQ